MCETWLFRVLEVKEILNSTSRGNVTDPENHNLIRTGEAGTSKGITAGKVNYTAELLENLCH